VLLQARGHGVQPPHPDLPPPFLVGGKPCVATTSRQRGAPQLRASGAPPIKMSRGGEGRVRVRRFTHPADKKEIPPVPERVDGGGSFVRRQTRSTPEYPATHCAVTGPPLRGVLPQHEGQMRVFPVAPTALCTAARHVGDTPAGHALPRGAPLTTRARSRPPPLRPRAPLFHAAPPDPLASWLLANTVLCSRARTVTGALRGGAEPTGQHGAAVAATRRHGPAQEKAGGNQFETFVGR